MSRPITPHLWYDKEATEAARFYCEVFPESSVTRIGMLHDTPSGDCGTVAFTLMGQPFEAISAGPHFAFNRTISFLVNFDPSRDRDAKGSLDRAWDRLSEGGTVVMPLGKYPFSAHYGCLRDRYGVSWHIVPAGLDDMLARGSDEQRDRVMKAMLPMKKIDIAALRRAFGE